MRGKWYGVTYQRRSGFGQGGCGKDEGERHLYGGALEMNENLFEVLRAFRLDTKPASCEPYGLRAHQCDLSCRDGKRRRYILQKINNNTFRDVAGLMENITAVTGVPADKNRRPAQRLTLVKRMTAQAICMRRMPISACMTCWRALFASSFPRWDEDFIRARGLRHIAAASDGFPGGEAARDHPEFPQHTGPLPRSSGTV